MISEFVKSRSTTIKAPRVAVVLLGYVIALIFCCLVSSFGLWNKSFFCLGLGSLAGLFQWAKNFGYRVCEVDGYDRMLQKMNKWLGYVCDLCASIGNDRCLNWSRKVYLIPVTRIVFRMGSLLNHEKSRPPSIEYNDLQNKCYTFSFSWFFVLCVSNV